MMQRLLYIIIRFLYQNKMLKIKIHEVSALNYTYIIRGAFARSNVTYKVLRYIRTIQGKVCFILPLHKYSVMYIVIVIMKLA